MDPVIEDFMSTILGFMPWIIGVVVFAQIFNIFGRVRSYGL